MKVYEVVADTLSEAGFKYAYTIPGTHIYHLNHSLNLVQRDFRHEMGVSFAADAYARVNGEPGLAIVTAGPGMLNGLSGLGQAYAEASPMLYISGETSRDEFHAFHGVDKPLAISSSSDPVVKNRYILDTSSPDRRVRDAVREALEGRRGPIHISIPYDVLTSDVSSTDGAGEIEGYVYGDLLERHITERFSRGRNLLLIGPELYVEYAEEILDILGDWIYISTAAQIGLGGVRHDRYAGHIEKSFQIHPTAAYVVSNSDKILALGLPENSPEIELLHKHNPSLEIDVYRPSMREEIYRYRYGYVYRAPIEELLNALSQIDTDLDVDVVSKHVERLTLVEDIISRERGRLIHQGDIAATLSRLDIDNYIVTCDTGGNEQWIREFLPYRRNVRYLYSGGFGSIGYSLPAGIGAYDAGKSYRGVLTVAGDGSLLMSLGELNTVAKHNIPIKIIVFNDSRYGILEMLSQDDIGEKIDGGLGHVDFSKIAGAVGLDAIQVDRGEELEGALRDLLRSRGPILLDIVSSGEEVPTLLRR